MTPEREAPNDVEVAAAIERVRLLIANFRMNNLTVAALEIVCAAASRSQVEGAQPVAWPPREPTQSMIGAGLKWEEAGPGATWRAMWQQWGEDQARSAQLEALTYTATGQTGGADERS